jgi:hypothetical protein
VFITFDNSNFKKWQRKPKQLQKLSVNQPAAATTKIEAATIEQNDEMNLNEYQNLEAGK